MRARAAALVLLGIGALALTVAVALPTILAPALVRIPLAQTARSEAVGHGLTVFYPGDLTVHNGVSVTSVRNIAGDAAAPEAGPDTAVWTVGNVLTDSEGVLVGVTQLTTCFDRRTGLAVQPCASARIDGDNRVTYRGQVFTFPFGTEQRDYEFFDPNARAAFPARFVGVEQIDGLEVYRFEEQIPETVTMKQDVPGELAGGAAGTTVTADAVYTNKRTLWVEPTTGSIINGQEQIRQWLRGPQGDGVTLLAGTLNFTPEAIASTAGLAAAGRDQVVLLTRTLPIVLGVVGLALVAGGIVLLLRFGRRPGPRARHAEVEAEERARQPS
jgi:Porin PorA